MSALVEPIPRDVMKKRLVLTLALLLAFSTAPVRADELHVGDKMDFSFTAVGGQQVSMKALAGKIVIVDMWATWCGPCMHEVPHMLQINQDDGPKGVQIIGISLDSDKDAMLGVTTSKLMTWPQFFDGLAWKNVYAQQWHVNGIPHCYLVGPDGTILWIGHPAAIDVPLTDALKNHPPVLVDPEIVKAQNVVLDQVEAAITDKNTAKAVKLLATVKPEAGKDAAFAARLDAVQQKLQDVGKQALTDVDALIDQKLYGQAVKKLNDLSQALAGTTTGKEIKAKLETLLKNPDAKAALDKVKTETTAGAALVAAQNLADAKNDVEAYRAMKHVVAQYPGTAAATTAAEIVAKYEKDADFVHKANSDQDTAKARALLGLGDSFRQSGLIEKAKAKYQAVVDQYQGTAEAAQAQKALSDLANAN